jgi:hypothetical protein
LPEARFGGALAKGDYGGFPWRGRFFIPKPLRTETEQLELLVNLGQQRLDFCLMARSNLPGHFGPGHLGIHEDEVGVSLFDLLTEDSITHRCILRPRPNHGGLSRGFYPFLPVQLPVVVLYAN